jgi:hypothetical protein
MNSAKYDTKAKMKSNEEFLRLIPAPDEVFLAAGKRAAINAGISDDVMEILFADPAPATLAR